MKSWAKRKAAIRDFFTQSTDVPFVWADAPMRLVRKPFGVLSIERSIVLGRDHHGYTFGERGTTFDIEAQRLLTINAQVYSRSCHDDAKYYLERARMGFSRQDLKEALSQSQLTLEETHPINPIEFSFQNRKESRASMDVVLRTRLFEEMPVTNVGYFDRIETSFKEEAV